MHQQTSTRKPTASSIHQQTSTTKPTVPPVYESDSTKISSKFTRGSLLKYLAKKPTLWKVDF
jgi:hypothetical protein